MTDRETSPLRLAALMLIATLSFVGLYYGAAILLPLVEAVIVWFIINALATAMRNPRGPGARLSQGAACVIAALILTVIAIGALWSGVRGVVQAGPQSISLQASLDPLIQRIAALVGADEAQIVNGVLDTLGLESLMQQVVLGLFGLINQFGVIAIYVAFLFADQAIFDQKMRALYPDPARRAEAMGFLNRIGRQISSYLWIMTKVSGLTAALSYVALKLFGIDHAMFWALMVFFLNFIPTIGSILGTVLPAAFALVQSGDLGSTALLTLLLGLVQFTIGNVLMPRMAGNALNLSFLVTILCLFVWGALWGVTGMFLAVPLTAMLVIILGEFPETRMIAQLLSKTGDLDPPPAAPEAGSKAP